MAVKFVFFGGESQGARQEPSTYDKNTENLVKSDWSQMHAPATCWIHLRFQPRFFTEK